MIRWLSEYDLHLLSDSAPGVVIGEEQQHDKLMHTHTTIIIKPPLHSHTHMAGVVQRGGGWARSSADTVDIQI